MNKFQLLTNTELLDLLVLYTTEYTQLLKIEEGFDECKLTIDEIVTELKGREQNAQQEDKPPLISPN